ncbi:MAG: ATP-binding protein, partial [Pseudomonadota bacterium]
MNALIGHTNQRHALALLVNQGRLPGSLLFSGAAGIGKRLVAREIAKQLLCESPTPAKQGGCSECSACRLINLGNHPDLRQMEWDSGEITVDDLRHTLSQLSLKPFMGRCKVTILNDVDTISVTGANILLKTLEEPRPDNYFILIATTPSRLPQTVLSRCQRWHFDRLSNTELSAILQAQGAGQEELDLVPFADGSCQALKSITTRAELSEEISTTLEAAWRGDHARMAKSASEWAADKEGIKERLAFLRTSIRQRLLENSADRNAAAVWAHALQNALDIEYLVIDRHVNATLAILQLLQSCD